MNTLDRVCRHLRQNPADILHPTCAAGMDMEGIRLIDRPCIQNLKHPRKQSRCPTRPRVFCDKREPMTEAEKAARMAPFADAMAKLDAGLSPCCGAPLETIETERSVWKACSRCHVVALHACRATGPEVPG